MHNRHRSSLGTHRVLKLFSSSFSTLNRRIGNNGVHKKCHLHYRGKIDENCFECACELDTTRKHPYIQSPPFRRYSVFQYKTTSVVCTHRRPYTLAQHFHESIPSSLRKGVYFDNANALLTKSRKRKQPHTGDAQPAQQVKHIYYLVTFWARHLVMNTR